MPCKKQTVGFEEKVVEIAIERLREFRNHPFQIREDGQMKQLKESIGKYGILNPLLVRPVPEGVYEILSGHRRKYAAKELGYRKLPVIIRVMSDEEAVLSMVDIINEADLDEEYGILHHQEGIDLVPANMELSGLEVSLSNIMSREMILKEYIDLIRDRYDYILIDCMPSLGVMTINALAAADEVIIPVQAAYLPVKGLQMLIKTVAVVKKRLNKTLHIRGILITMVDYRTNYAKDITAMLRESYGENAGIGVMESFIPYSTKVAETSAEGISIFRYAPRCKAAEGFIRLTEEVLKYE